MSIVLSLDREKAKRELKKKAREAYKMQLQADISDDGYVVMLHFDYGEQVDLYLQDLLQAYLREIGADVPPE